jgi:hypothetical protein
MRVFHPSQQKEEAMNRIYDEVVNPNERALIVPQEQGDAEGDNYFGSIGDATARHVHSLDHSDRQLWESLIVTRNGAVFRTEPSPMWHDPDMFGLRGKDMEKYFEKIRRDNRGRFIPHSDFVHLQEAMEEEAERQEKSEDVYDRSELLPYDQMEKFPGMMKHIEMPSTPKDLLIFMGSTERKFYDEFPEGHPDAKVIDQALAILNQPWEKLVKDPETLEYWEDPASYLQWFKDWLAQHCSRGYVWKYMARLADALAEPEDCNPEEETRKALSEIDRCWGIEYMNGATERFQEDPIYSLMLANRKEWAAEAKQGKSMYGTVKAFGKTLFDTFKGETEPNPFSHYGMGASETRPKLRRHHWQLYREIKKAHSPRVVVHGYDVNRCSMSTLKFIFGEKAEDVWFQRPFDSVEELGNRGFMDRKVFADSEVDDKIMAEMEKAAEHSKKTGNLRAFNDYRLKVLAAQKKGIKDYNGWTQVWAYYHVLRKELQQHFQKGSTDERSEQPEQPRQEEAAAA